MLVFSGVPAWPHPHVGGSLVQHLGNAARARAVHPCYFPRLPGTAPPWASMCADGRIAQELSNVAWRVMRPPTFGSPPAGSTLAPVCLFAAGLTDQEPSNAARAPTRLVAVGMLPVGRVSVEAVLHASEGRLPQQEPANATRHLGMPEAAHRLPCAGVCPDRAAISGALETQGLSNSF
eukprot:NODE_4644_length_1866_cov_2.878091.p2 GENE.NODE_4644_length_1866_cov_2.878091~~NODE_4644_length_1866_cov_2.878091.p2  ORF type:complete len:178 (-),score=44.89 NODE_4644_length_1866_cov_2.878091:659-1192(-)